LTTLQEWTSAVCAELERAGFVVEEHAGFPIVRVPLSAEQRMGLLEVRLSVSVEKRIYGEGMLFLPAGRPGGRTRG